MPSLPERDQWSQIKRYLYFLTLKPKTYQISDLYSDTETNIYLLKNYTKIKSTDNNIFGDFGGRDSIFSLDVSPLDSSKVSFNYENLKNFKKNNYNIYRSTSRKDTSLKNKRNLFFSNHILND